MDAGNLAELQALMEAAKRGDVHAQTTLGLAFELGHGVVRDVFHASHLYRQAALAGGPRGQYALALLYESGCGESPQPELARSWYELAARQGHEGALRRLRCLDAEPGADGPSPHLRAR